MPHVYGVSYFSSKGPTGDGRLKPESLRTNCSEEALISSSVAGGGASGLNVVPIARELADLMGGFEVAGARFEETGEMPAEEWATVFIPTDDNGALLRPI